MIGPDFWRSGRLHAINRQFRIIAGPYVDPIGETDAWVQWSMSDLSSGQVFYGKTASYGQQTTLQPGGVYSDHRQRMVNLDPDTTYHYRVESTSADGVTVTSGDLTFQTAGTSLVAGAGVRYGEATWPGRSATTWPTFPTIGGSTVLVPASVLTAANVAGALESFLNGLADGTTVVFDRTLGGAGTVYNFNDRVQLGTSGVVKSNITYWAYNSTFNQSRTTSGTGVDFLRNSIFHWRYGGVAGMRWYGGHLVGPNYRSHQWNTRSVGSEAGHALALNASWQDVKFLDVYMQNLCGDGIYLSAGNPTLSWEEFDQQGRPADMEIAYCHLDGSGRQGFVLNQGTRMSVHHNILEYVAIYPIDAEDEALGGGGYPNGFMRYDAVDITDNIFREWTVNADPNNVWNPAAISFRRIVGDEFGLQQYMTVARNLFEGGAFGYGSPEGEAYMQSLGYTGTVLNGYGAVMKWKPNSLPHVGYKILDNVFNLRANQDRYNGSTTAPERMGNAVVMYSANGLEISGNDFGNRGVYLSGCSNVTLADLDMTKVKQL